jgi:hypothetical protein
MTPEEVPQELIVLLSKAFGKEWAAREVLAEVLTRYDTLKLETVEAYSRRTYPSVAREIIDDRDR